MAENRAAGPGSALIIQLFGPPEVRLGDDPLPRLRSRKGQWLLALLTLRHGCAVERAWLAGMLWPDSPESQAFYNLRRCLTDLRRALGPEAERLRSLTPHTLCLELAGVAADVVAFDDAIARGGTSERSEVVLPSLERAISLYRGPLLEGCEEEWAFPERRVREEAFLTALERLAAGAAAAGDPAAAVRYLRRAVAVDPLAETAQRALMQALAASGSGAAATEVYRDFRLRLHRELNAQPAPETSALYQQLRAEAREKAAPGSKLQAPGPTTGEPASRPAEWQALSHAGSLEPGAWSRSEATWTFLFTDIESSTQLWEGHPEAMREALPRHDSLLHDAVEAHSGVVFKSMGDQICAAFPRAPDALSAALAAQRALLDDRWPMANGRLTDAVLTNPESRAGTDPALRAPASGRRHPQLKVRMALHTGAAEERQGDYFGPTLSRVARLLEAGHGGQILLSQSAYDLCRDYLPGKTELRSLGEHRLKDLARPERIFQVIRPDLPADFLPLRTLDARPHNLPVQPTPLLGREQEVAAAGERLRSEALRLLTLTGPGGTGKTRLGLQVAAELLDAFENGIYVVALASISHPGLVVSAIAQRLGVRETPGRMLSESLQEYLRDKQLLLLLDNFEHVLSAAPLVSELLAGCPRLKALVTSRAPLHLRGEQQFPVPPLSLPDPKHLPPLEQLSQYAAVALFVQQAQAVKPEFAVTNENAPAVAEICHRLDGLPLAVELAAARVKLFPPPALLARMASRLKLLTGGAQDLPARQQTLRGAIAWSYDLLDEDEKRLFRRLSAFVGGFAVEAVEAVCSVEGDLDVDALDGVESLVNKSLLQPQEESSGGEPRFRMLETIREYAQERLVESGEAEAIRRQHAGFFLALAESNARFDRLERELDNLRAALGWFAESGNTDADLRFAAALRGFWRPRGYVSEGRRWVEGALARSQGTPHPRCARVPGSSDPGRMRGRANALDAAADLAKGQSDIEAARSFDQERLVLLRELKDQVGVAWCHWHLGLLAQQQGEYETARSYYHQSLAMAEELGEKSLIALNLNDLGYVAYLQGDQPTARALLEQSLAIARKLNLKGIMGFALGHLGEVADAQGDYKAAQALMEESLALFAVDDNKGGRGFLLHRMGRVAQHQADWGAARSRYAESLPILRDIGNRGRIADCLEGFAAVAGAQEQPERAARLLGAAEALRETIGIPLAPVERPDYDGSVASARASLGEAAFAAAWAEGRAMPLEEAMCVALEDDEIPTPGQQGS